MIGNDIVDLEKAKKESNWQRNGFLGKLFTKNEQQTILTSEDAELMVWQLWTRKEAAYKIYNRQSAERFFNPKQFVCEDDAVVYKTKKYYTQTEITPCYIYSIAATSTEQFAAIHHLISRDAIQKLNGVPIWFDRTEGHTHPASITHHGRFTRIAYFKK